VSYTSDYDEAGEFEGVNAEGYMIPEKVREYNSFSMPLRLALTKLSALKLTRDMILFLCTADISQLDSDSKFPKSNDFAVFHLVKKETDYNHLQPWMFFAVPGIPTVAPQKFGRKFNNVNPQDV